MPGCGSYRRTVAVNNPLGLHLRPAAAFAQAARGFHCAITVWNGDRRADGKSPWDLLGLIAEYGAELVVEADGDDAADAIARLADLLAATGESRE